MAEPGKDWGLHSRSPSVAFTCLPGPELGAGDPGPGLRPDVPWALPDVTSGWGEQVSLGVCLPEGPATGGVSAFTKPCIPAPRSQAGLSAGVPSGLGALVAGWTLLTVLAFPLSFFSTSSSLLTVLGQGSTYHPYYVKTAVSAPTPVFPTERSSPPFTHIFLPPTGRHRRCCRRCKQSGKQFFTVGLSIFLGR